MMRSDKHASCVQEEEDNEDKAKEEEDEELPVVCFAKHLLDVSNADSECVRDRMRCVESVIID